MHGVLETPAGFTLMGADTPPGMEHRTPAAASISLSGDDAEELRGYWERLGDGATITMPLAKQVWGDTFGMLTDRFGIEWLVNIAE
jgi:PhnB protein